MVEMFLNGDLITMGSNPLKTNHQQKQIQVFAGEVYSDGKLIWLVVPTHLKNISQNESFPPIGVKMKNL